MDPAILRSLERILAVAIGGMSIWLGYRLFIALPEQRDGSGSFKLPWNISVVLSRVGPGVFFALFGAAVVAFGLHSAVSVTTERTVAPGGAVSETVNMRGMGQGAATSGETPAVQRLRAEVQVRFLNALPLRNDLGLEEKQSTADQVAAIKLALMRSVWDPDWGDAAAFTAWIDSRATAEPAPRTIQNAVMFFRAGIVGGAP
jgi:hypothetical protein